jgi:hypothetical protein
VAPTMFPKYEAQSRWFTAGGTGKPREKRPEGAWNADRRCPKMAKGREGIAIAANFRVDRLQRLRVDREAQKSRMPPIGCPWTVPIWARPCADHWQRFKLTILFRKVHSQQNFIISDHMTSSRRWKLPTWAGNFCLFCPWPYPNETLRSDWPNRRGALEIRQKCLNPDANAGVGG